MGIETQAGQSLAAATDPTVDLGRKLRDARQRLGLSLADVAETTGLSISWLSRVERGQIDISFNRLMNLLNCYKLTLTELLGEQEFHSPHIVHRGDRVASLATPDGYDITILAPTRGKRMLPMLATYKPGIRRNDFAFSEGDEFIYVVKGTIKLEFQDGSEHVLRTGDSAYYPASQPHRLTAVGQTEAEVVAAVTPPW